MGNRLLLICCALLGLLSLPACVPLTTYYETENKRSMLSKINADLEKRMTSLKFEASKDASGVGMARERLAGLQKELAASKDRVRTLETENERLRKGLSDVPPIAIQDASFDEDDLRDLGAGAHLRNGDLILDSDLLFSAGKFNLKPSARDALDRVARVILDKYPDSRLHLSGHTDVDPIGKSAKINKDNWDLGMKRAHAVFAHLKSKGIPESNMVVISYGSAQPYDGVDPKSAAGKAKCRRVEIHLAE